MQQAQTFYPAKSLLLEHIQTNADDQIIILEGGDGWLAYEVATLVPKGMVFTHDRDIRNIERAQASLSNLENAISEAQALPKMEGSDIVLLTIPKERSYARLLLIASFLALKVGGQLLLAGPSRTGAKAVINDAKRLFGNGVILGYRSHQRIARCSKEREFTGSLPDEFQKPGIAPNSRQSFEVETKSGSLTLETCPGIFSWEKPDAGTEMLLDHMAVNPGSVVWDVGCGYGILGLYAAISGADTVLMSDTNTLATTFAKKNSRINNLGDKVRVFTADNLSLPDDEDFISKVDLIISNPAFHQGKRVDKTMVNQIITKAPGYLMPGGRLLIVANRFLNYHKTMQTTLKQVKIITANNRFHVMEGWNP